MRRPAIRSLAAAGALAFAALAGPAAGQPVVGAPEPWQVWHNIPATPVARRLEDFHQLLVAIIVLICAIVFALLAVAVWRFRESRSPVPSRTTHNTAVEVLWTVVPVAVLVVIAIPSFRILYEIERIPEDAMTVKVVGHQWYWEYVYPDHGDVAIDSYVIPDDDLEPDQLRILEVDQPLVLPVGRNVRLQITSADVLHSWGVSSLGFTRDAIPGRLNETWARIEREGVFYGHCRELCGLNHPFMSVAIRAVPPEEFDAWIAARRGGEG